VRIEHWWYSIPLRLRGLFRRPVVECELDDELRDHIESQISANIASGMRAEDARRAALVAFGGVERVKDESRDIRGLSTIDGIAQLRFAVRSLWRARVFTIATTATIALAVGAGCAVFALVHAVLLRPLPYPESDRLVGLWHAFPGIEMPLVRQSPGTYVSYRQSARLFESIGAYADGEATLTPADPALSSERVPASGVAGAIFTMLRVRPLLGRVISDADEKPGAVPVVVISERYWRTRLGAAPDVLGRTLRINGGNREIVGVMPESFAFPGSDVQLWMAINVVPNAYLGNFTFRALGRLRPGVSIEAAQAELHQILMRTPESFAEQRPGVSTASILARTKATVVVHTMRDDVIGGFDRVLWLVAATVGLLVIVAFSNVGSLVLARVEARRREFAIRAALGGSRGRIWSSLIAELAIVSSVGGAIGLMIAFVALSALIRVAPSHIPDPMLANGGITILPRLDEVHVGWPLVISALTLTALFCAVSGLIGHWRMGSADALRVLREGGRSGTAGRASQRMRAAFVAVEVAMSLVLLSGSAVLAGSFLRLRAIHPGFNPAGALTFWTFVPRWEYRTESSVAEFYRRALERVERVPGVAAVGIVSKLPLDGGVTGRIIWVEDTPRRDAVLPPNFAISTASRGYFAAMQIPLLAGRSFDEASVRRGLNEAIVSRGFAVQHWSDSSGRRAIGRRIRPGTEGPWYTVVGVVGDVRDTALTAPATAGVYFPSEISPDSADFWRVDPDMAFVVRARGSAAAVAALVEREIRSIDPRLQLHYLGTMQAIVAKAGSRMTFSLLLLTAGAVATLVLGIIGLYGVVAYVVGMRSREIGIRIALGLVPARAARLVLRQGTGIIVVGAALGLVVFVAFAKLLRSLVFEVSVVDGPSLAVAAAIVVIVANLATWAPARRAARIDPVVTLKDE
jgi:putative ABC transport system permease protein